MTTYPAHVAEALAQLDQLEDRLAELSHPSLAFGHSSSLRDLGALHLRSIRRLVETYGAASMPPPPPSAPPPTTVSEYLERRRHETGLRVIHEEQRADALTTTELDDLFPHTDPDPTPPHGTRLPTLAEALEQQAARATIAGLLEPGTGETFEELRRRTLTRGFSIGETT